LPLTWLFLVRGIAKRSADDDIELPKLGPIDRDQLWVLIVFCVTAALWITRGNFGPLQDPDDPLDAHRSFGALQGWGSRLEAHGILVRDSSVAIAAALVLFVVPRRSGGRILDWSVAPRLPWGVMLLLGAGFAISGAFDHSGLTLWIGSQIEGFGQLAWTDTALLLALLTTIVAVSIVVTEFASNTASANILLPVIFGVSVVLGPERFPPDLLMISCALACTTGFAMPAGTPPNALVFATERISIGRFARTGLVIDALSLVLIVALMMAYHWIA